MQVKPTRKEVSLNLEGTHNFISEYHDKFGKSSMEMVIAKPSDEIIHNHQLDIEGKYIK